MTEQKVIKYLNYFQRWNEDDRWLSENDMKELTEYCIDTIKEVQRYRKIGTVEEFQEAKGTQEPKEIIRIAGRYPYKCPTCNGKLEIGYKHCIICGQLLKYPYENLEGLENEG